MLQLGKYKPTVIALVAANFIPVVGVLLLGWSVFAIMAIYWCENVIIGVINVLKMITCCPDIDEIQRAQARTRTRNSARAKLMQAALAQAAKQGAKSRVATHVAKLFFVPFFTVHYGMFCLVHGVFVLVLFGGEGQIGGGMDGGIEQLTGQVFQGGLILSVLALAASHLFSFFKNYIAGGEYRRTVLPVLMIQPYGRIVVMHLAVLFGGFAVMFLDSSVFALLILIVGKTVIDITLHLRQHRRGDIGSDSDELGQVETV
jgi:hypothetical protein